MDEMLKILQVRLKSFHFHHSPACYQQDNEDYEYTKSISRGSHLHKNLYRLSETAV
uniref:Uncharacterized protein n=1 Tax=Octopus bimaculoides TaxID=37653 RepID=A0A0L8GTR2_OCTBM